MLSVVLLSLAAAQLASAQTFQRLGIVDPSSVVSLALMQVFA